MLTWKWVSITKIGTRPPDLHTFVLCDVVQVNQNLLSRQRMITVRIVKIWKYVTCRHVLCIHVIFWRKPCQYCSIIPRSAAPNHRPERGSFPGFLRYSTRGKNCVNKLSIETYLALGYRVSGVLRFLLSFYLPPYSEWVKANDLLKQIFGF